MDGFDKVNIIQCDFRPWCLYCSKPMDNEPEGKCCSPECEKAAADLERRSLDEILDDRLERKARLKFLNPINPDPLRAMAAAMKKPKSAKS